MADATKTLRIKQIKSSIGYKYDQGQTLRSLGLGKINRVVEQFDRLGRRIRCGARGAVGADDSARLQVEGRQALAPSAHRAFVEGQPPPVQRHRPQDV